MQIPRPEHSSGPWASLSPLITPHALPTGQRSSEQSYPKNPSWHWQVSCLSQTPLPEQPLGQDSSAALTIKDPIEAVTTASSSDIVLHRVMANGGYGLEMGSLQFLASLHFGFGQMKRTTREERRCANELRRGARISESMSSMASGGSGVSRPTIETKTKSVIPTPLIATAALQAYLLNDIDAKSRIPRPRPAPESRGKESRSMISPDGKRLSSVNTLQRSKTKRSESLKPTQLRVVVHGNDTFLAQSPLSRFHKHMKQERSAPDWTDNHQELTIVPQWGHSQSHPEFCRGDTFSVTTTPTTKNLTRSLMEKIKEAKDLRQVETASYLDVKHHLVPSRGLQTPNDHKFLKDSLTNSASLQPTVKKSMVQSSSSREHYNETLLAEITTIDLTFSPPVPHAKPVMPVILQLSSPEKSTPENISEKTTEEPTREPASKGVKSNVDDMIVAMKAANLIQRVWRQKRLLVRSRRRNKQHGTNVDQHEHAHVTLIIDKSGGAITPLFSVAKSRKQQMAEEQQQQQHSKLEYEAEMVDEREDTAKFYPSFHPWTDHELIFLEEGRCIGELYESVRKGVFMDQDELVWKRPHQVIEQLETQRISNTQKTRRKREPSRQAHNHVVFTTPDSNVKDSSATISPIQESPRSDSQEVLVSTNSRTPTGGSVTLRKRKLPRVHLIKHKMFKRRSVFCAVRGSSKARRIFSRVLPDKASTNAETSHPTRQIGAPQFGEVLCCKSSVEHPCNPLSELGEIEEQSVDTLDQHGSSDVGTDMIDRFIVFSDSGQTSIDTKYLRNDLIRVGDLALASSLLYDEHHRHVPNDDVQLGFIPLTLDIPGSSGTQPTMQSEVLSDDSPLEPTLATTASLGSDVGDTGVAALQVNESFSGIQRVRHLDEGPEDLSQHEQSWTWEDLVEDVDNNAVHDSLASPASSVVNKTMSRDPMRAFNDMKSAVTDTMTRIHTQYRDEVQDQIIPVAEPTRLRLDEEKRIEFLRVLDDFKRCLQPSSASSTRSSLLSGRQQH